MRKVLVAVDESEASERAADFVNAFFGGLDVVIVGLNVGAAPLAWGPYPAAPGLLYAWPYAAPMAPAVTPRPGPENELPQDAAERIDWSGLEADEHVVELGGDVAETLREVASDRDVDVIVVGSGHKGLLERMLSPSVSADLAKSAPRPVLVVH